MELRIMMGLYSVLSVSLQGLPGRNGTPGQQGHPGPKVGLVKYKSRVLGLMCSGKTLHFQSTGNSYMAFCVR